MDKSRWLSKAGQYCLILTNKPTEAKQLGSSCFRNISYLQMFEFKKIKEKENLSDGPN